MTASQQAKAAWLKSLAVAVEVTGVFYQTLTNWHKNKPVCQGCYSWMQGRINWCITQSYGATVRLSDLLCTKI